LPRQHELKLGHDISIGSVNTTKINAVCTTDTRGHYAIVINSSLFTYLHKYGKLLSAVSNPSIVTYCNRKSPETLTREDIMGYINELPQIYFVMNQVMGPMIHLNNEAQTIHMLILEIAEKFILGHELGHYFRGHLDNNANTELFLGEFQKLKNNNHDLEFEADDFGYELVKNWIAGSKPELLQEAFLYSGVSLVFTGLNSLNPYASETHPAPMDRLKRLFKNMELAKSIPG
jgi:hypothetical protein